MSQMLYESKFTGNISQWKVGQVTDMSAIFRSSLFKDDLTEWPVYQLQGTQDIFTNCPAPIPYWAEIENKGRRRKAIESYQFSRKLENALSNKNSNIKKNKI